MADRVNSYAHVTYEDFSGIATGQFANPYDALIESCNHDPKQIQERYDTHRIGRNAQQKAKILSSDFTGISIDPVLSRLEDPSIEPGFKDPRYCLVFWARPPQSVKDLITEIQKKVLAVVPNSWIMPTDCLHMTTLEVTHSRTEPTIENLVSTILPHASSIVDYTRTHKARLIKPLIGYDNSAFALSFAPAAGEALPSGRTKKDDEYTYHHLRRDIYGKVKETGVEVDSRYTVPSAHLTLGRFIDKKDFEGEDGKQSMQKLVQRIEEINEWLKEEYWPKEESGSVKDGGEWIVGDEKGLDFRKGTLWYGGGETVMLGKGI